MVSRIKEARPHDFVSIEHVGVVQDGKEDSTSDTAKQLAPALEKMFQASWPKALQQLKQLAER